MSFQKGSTFKICKGAGKPYKAHVLEIVDGNMVVYKWFGRHKRWWHYSVEDAEHLEIMNKIAEERIEKLAKINENKS